MMTVEERKEYFKRYYQENKEHCRKLHDDWIEKHKGDFVYFHINEDGKTLYIGSFYSRPLIERQSFHMIGKSNLKINYYDYTNKYNFSEILYKDFSGHNLNVDELHFIENYYIDKYKPKLNKKHNNNESYNNQFNYSKNELIKIAENEELKIFNTDKYLN